MKNETKYGIANATFALIVYGGVFLICNNFGLELGMTYWVLATLYFAYREGTRIYKGE